MGKSIPLAFLIFSFPSIFNHSFPLPSFPYIYIILSSGDLLSISIILCFLIFLQAIIYNIIFFFSFTSGVMFFPLFSLGPLSYSFVSIFGLLVFYLLILLGLLLYIFLIITFMFLVLCLLLSHPAISFITASSTQLLPHLPHSLSELKARQ